MHSRNYTTMLGAFMLLTLLSSCAKDGQLGNSKSDTDTALEQQLETLGGKASFILPDSDDLRSIPADPNNPLTKEKVALGKLLYHETGLGLAPIMGFSKGTYSCASCHFASAGFQAGTFQGLGDGAIGFGSNGEGRVKNAQYIGDQVDCQPVRTPTVINGAYQKLMLWNGQFGATSFNIGTEAQWTQGTPKFVNNLGYEGLETQAIAGLSVHRLVVTDSLITALGYKEMFDAALSDLPPTRRYSKEGAGLAIAAYERTVMSNKAPFQDWLKGDYSALSEDEKKGALLFFKDANCTSCHTGPALNSMTFYAIGMKDLHDCPEEVFRTPANDPAHKGRGGFTKRAEDNYKFKTPQLYNLGDSPFYGHGASKRSIYNVVSYKNKGVAENDRVPTSQLAAEFKPLNLSNDEVSAIAIFLTRPLRDPDLMRYQPSSVNSGHCIPNSDPLSKNQLGCD